MTISICVLGVLGLCRVGLVYPTQTERPKSLVCKGVVLGVLGLASRTRVRAIFRTAISQRKNLYARTNKPNKPNTLNTYSSNQLISLDFVCVGFVSSCVNVCWVAISGVFR